MSPKRASKNITVLTQNLKSVFNKGLIQDNKDIVLYNTLGYAMQIIKIKDNDEKKRVIYDINYSY